MRKSHAESSPSARATSISAAPPRLDRRAGRLGGRSIEPAVQVPRRGRPARARAFGAGAGCRPRGRARLAAARALLMPATRTRPCTHVPAGVAPVRSCAASIVPRARREQERDQETHHGRRRGSRPRRRAGPRVPAGARKQVVRSERSPALARADAILAARDADPAQRDAPPRHAEGHPRSAHSTARAGERAVARSNARARTRRSSASRSCSAAARRGRGRAPNTRALQFPLHRHELLVNCIVLAPARGTAAHVGLQSHAGAPRQASTTTAASIYHHPTSTLCSADSLMKPRSGELGSRHTSRAPGCGADGAPETSATLCRDANARRPPRARARSRGRRATRAAARAAGSRARVSARARARAAGKKPGMACAVGSKTARARPRMPAIEARARRGRARAASTTTTRPRTRRCMPGAKSALSSLAFDVQRLEPLRARPSGDAAGRRAPRALVSTRTSRASRRGACRSPLHEPSRGAGAAAVALARRRSSRGRSRMSSKWPTSRPRWPGGSRRRAPRAAPTTPHRARRRRAPRRRRPSAPPRRDRARAPSAAASTPGGASRSSGELRARERARAASRGALARPRETASGGFARRADEPAAVAAPPLASRTRRHCPQAAAGALPGSPRPRRTARLPRSAPQDVATSAGATRARPRSTAGNTATTRQPRPTGPCVEEFQ